VNPQSAGRLSQIAQGALIGRGRTQSSETSAACGQGRINKSGELGSIDVANVGLQVSIQR
jgi:hypothetical protein